MLDDIEKLSYKYYKPREGFIMVFEWSGNIVQHDFYTLADMKLAKAKQQEIAGTHDNLAGKTISKTSIIYCFNENHGWTYITLAIKEFNQA